MKINFDKIAQIYQENGSVATDAIEALKPLMLAQIRRYYPNYKEAED